MKSISDTSLRSPVIPLVRSVRKLPAKVGAKVQVKVQARAMGGEEWIKSEATELEAHISKG